MPTKEQILLYLNREIEIWTRRVDKWRDTSMPAYRGAVERKVQLEAERERVILQRSKTQRSEGHPRLGAKGLAPYHQKPVPPQLTFSKRRAKTVEQILKELQIVKPKMHNDSHYLEVNRYYAKYLIFKIAKKDNDVRQWIENVQDRIGLVGLAQEIAARHYGKSLSTIKTDWSHRKAKSKC